MPCLTISRSSASPRLLFKEPGAQESPYGCLQGLLASFIRQASWRGHGALYTRLGVRRLCSKDFVHFSGVAGVGPDGLEAGSPTQ